MTGPVRRTGDAASRDTRANRSVAASPIAAIRAIEPPHAASHAPRVPRSAMPSRTVSRAMYAWKT